MTAKSQCMYCNVSRLELDNGVCTECTAVLNHEDLPRIYEEIVRRISGKSHFSGIIHAMEITPEWKDAAFNIDSKWMAVIVGKLKGDQRVRVEATGQVHNPDLYRVG